MKQSWNDYFLNILNTVSTRATCNRGKCGCVIVKDNRIVSTGYVGAPSGMPDCDNVGHLLRKITYEDGTQREHCFRTIHAEANAILYAAKEGISLKGATLYCTMLPCISCAHAIVSVGIVSVVAQFNYQASQYSQEIFKKFNVDFKIINDKTMEYSN